MDWVKIIYMIILLGCSISIYVTTFSQKDDERRQYISRKAQAYSFMVVFGMLILELGASLFLSLQGNELSMDQGISPLSFLTVISIIYLATLLVYRKKYGD